MIRDFKNLRLPTKVAFSTVDFNVEISTVDLQSFNYGADFYETCVFLPTGHSEVVARYSTLAAAKHGHDSIVKQVKSYLKAKNPSNLLLKNLQRP